MTDKHPLIVLYEECAKPDPAKIEFLPKPKAGLSLEFYNHAYVTADLIKHDPEWSFAITHIVERGSQVEVLGTLTVHGVTRACVGYAAQSKEDPGKEAISDMIKNGAMRFGVALDLWAKGDIDTGKKTVDAKPVPQPARRTPEAAQAEPTRPPTKVELIARDVVALAKSLDAGQQATFKGWIAEYLGGKKIVNMAEAELLQCKEQIAKIQAMPDAIAEAFPGAEVI